MTTWTVLTLKYSYGGEWVQQTTLFPGHPLDSTVYRKPTHMDQYLSRTQESSHQTLSLSGVSQVEEEKHVTKAFQALSTGTLVHSPTRGHRIAVRCASLTLPVPDQEQNLVHQEDPVLMNRRKSVVYSIPMGRQTDP